MTMESLVIKVDICEYYENSGQLFISTESVCDILRVFTYTFGWLWNDLSLFRTPVDSKNDCITYRLKSSTRLLFLNVRKDISSASKDYFCCLFSKMFEIQKIIIIKRIEDDEKT